MPSRAWRVVWALSLVLPAHACARGSDPGRYPESPIELVVPFQAGGGSDNLARMIQTIATDEGLVPVPVNVVNKPGGAGALGLAYVASKPGDPNTLMTTIDTVVSVPLQPEYQGPSYKDLTILGVLALDDMLVVVPAASRFATIDELVEYGRANPGGLKLATNAARGEDHIFGAMIERATGARFTFVHTRGGAEAMQNVLGGHVDIAVPNPSETLSQLEGGLVRALAVASSERLPILPDVPTLRERGIDVEYRMFRGIAMPANVPPAVRTYWEDVLRRVTETPRWRTEYVERLALTPKVLFGPDAERFFEDLERAYRSTLEQLVD